MNGVALVTGAARGIGLATTRRFVDQGMRVAMVDRDGDVLLAAAAEFGDAVESLIYDVSIPEQVDAIAEQVTRDFGACKKNMCQLLCSRASQKSHTHRSAIVSGIGLLRSTLDSR